MCAPDRIESPTISTSSWQSGFRDHLGGLAQTGIITSIRHPAGPAPPLSRRGHAHPGQAWLSTLVFFVQSIGTPYVKDYTAVQRYSFRPPPGGLHKKSRRLLPGVLALQGSAHQYSMPRNLCGHPPADFHVHDIVALERFSRRHPGSRLPDDMVVGICALI